MGRGRLGEGGWRNDVQMERARERCTSLKHLASHPGEEEINFAFQNEMIEEAMAGRAEKWSSLEAYRLAGRPNGEMPVGSRSPTGRPAAT